MNLPTNPSASIRKRNPHLFGAGGGVEEHATKAISECSKGASADEGSCPQADSGIPPSKPDVIRHSRNQARPARAIEKETDLQDEIVGWCKRRGWLVVRANPTKKSTILKGWPDLTIFADGCHTILIECKFGNGVLTKEQSKIRSELAALGHYVHIVTSLEDWRKLITKLLLWDMGQNPAMPLHQQIA